MSNSFYNKTNAPSPNSPGSSAQIRNEFDLVYQAFNKMPVLSLANANKLVAINALGTGLTQVNTLTNIGGIDNTPIGATTPSTGAFTNLSAFGAVGLGTNVTINGGAINNSIIGGVTPNAAYFTTAAASSGFTGNLTGNVTGNVTGNLTGNVTGNIASSGTSTFNNLTITGTLDMSSGTAGTITGLSAPTNASDAATKSYVDTADALKLNLAGGTMSGDIAMGSNRISGMANPVNAQDSATKNYVDTADALKLSLAGGTMSGALGMGGFKITGLGLPTATTDAATKGYVDNAIQGLDAKASVRVATTTNINLTGTQTVDGVALSVGDRVLVKNQDTPASNGLYTVSSGVWTRTTDGDSWDELVSAYVFVEDGTTNGRNGFLCTITQGGTIGVTSVSWVQFNSAGQIDAGSGLTKTGNRLDVATASPDRIVVNPDNIDLAATGISAGTYKSVVVDIYGRVISGGNPNSLSGYGILDAYSKTEADTLYGTKLNLSGGTMSGALAMGNNRITGLAAPTANGDAATKLYADGKLSLAGGTMSGAIAMGSNKITGLADPTVAQDAVTLNYITTLYGSTASAAASASAAAGSQTAAANSATSAGNSATAAASSASAAAASYDAFDDRYLGSKTSDPTTDNDGNALIDGALYWNSTLGLMKAYKLATTSWVVSYVPSDFYTAGPASSTANGIALFDGTTGKLLKDSASTDGLIRGMTIGLGGGAVGGNTALGEGALAVNTTGNYNTASGYATLNANTTGQYNSAFGRGALQKNTTGSSNTATGVQSLFNSTTASNNTAVGYQAGYANTTGAGNFYGGYLAGSATTTGNYNVYVGARSGLVATANYYNVGVGYQALQQNATDGNTALGFSAAYTNSSGSGLVAVGYQANQNNTTGSSNTAIGYQALNANTTASANTAVGYQAGYSNVTGTQITALGYQAGYSFTGNQGLFVGHQSGYYQTGGFNTAIGISSQVGANGTSTGTHNVSVGYASLTSVTSGAFNTAISDQALYSNTTGSNNTAVGFQSLYSNTVGVDNAAFGQYALYANTTGSSNLASGKSSLGANTTGSNNTALGFYALTQSTTASNNTAVGYQAGYSNSTGAGLTFVGNGVGYGNTTGTDNVAMGGGYSHGSALYTNSTGSFNVAIGGAALKLSNANYNTAVGHQALTSNTTASANTAVGYQAMYANTTASYNAAFGYQAMYANTTGAANTGLGYQCLKSNTTGINNTAVGSQSMIYSTTASNNTGLGQYALVALTTGADNSAVGKSAMYANTTGAYNTAFGSQALYNNTVGSYNTGIGNLAGYNSAGNSNTYVGWAAGYSATGTGNTLVGTSAGYNLTTGIQNTFVGPNTGSSASGHKITTGSKNTILGAYDGNQGGLDIRTANNYVVLSDGDGNPRLVGNPSGAFGLGGNSSVWSNYYALEGTGYGCALAFNSATSQYVQTANAYYNGGWLHKNTGNATLTLVDGGQWYYYTGNNDAAGTPVSWTNRVNINAQGIGLGGTSPSSGMGITFPATQSASSDANTLDDYEEGTWTPTLGGNTTYIQQAGNYVKIGKTVWINWIIQINAIGTGSATRMSGLPFAYSGTAPRASGSIAYLTAAATNAYWWLVNIDNAYVYFDAWTASGTSISGDPSNMFGNSTYLMGSATYITTT